jgi:hypothetical protein
MFIVLVSYRARGIQQFRREQLAKSLQNFRQYFELNKMDYKIVICEQNNHDKFNRGFLLNAAFIESERNFDFSKKYIHMNTDYNFNLSIALPQEFLDLKQGFIDLHRPPYPVLGAACVFDSDSYKTINGFPNDLDGWGGDDWAIYNRIVRNNVNLMTPENIFNRGLIVEENVRFALDSSNNDRNMRMANRNDDKFNGLNSIKYTVDGLGEFHDGVSVFHNLIGYSKFVPNGRFYFNS